MVYLVGAGPGDPGLITVKALDIMRRADVVLYDRLVNANLLCETKAGCTLIDVGKSAGKHTKSQDEIIDLLVEYGKKDIEVLRLKGGDPYLFGRGAEEAERLQKEGILFEIVPGVTALTAATTYAGIPITHRDFASSFAVATGHGASDKSADPVRWRELAGSVDTIVVFMGIGQIDNILEELVAGGLSKSTPAAVIEKGTTALQRVVTGTIETISDDIIREGVKPPALFVAGETVTLHDTLNWFKPGPLAGLRIGVTRPLAQSKAFIERLSSLGAQPIPMPVIKTEDTIDNDDVTKIIGRVSEYDTIVFSSVNGVESFFRALRKNSVDTRSLAGVTVAAIGPITADTLDKYGIKADIVAERYVAEGLFAAITEQNPVEGRKFALVRSDIGRSTLSDELGKAGAIVDSAIFYSTMKETLTPHMVSVAQQGNIDIITFTSSSTVDNFFSQVSAEEIGDGVKIASIGPQTSITLGNHSMKPDVEAEAYTTAGLTDAILKAYGKK